MHATDEYISDKKRRRYLPSTMALVSAVRNWKGRSDFLFAQLKVALIIAVAYVGNNWEPSYPRNDNHAPDMFWVMNFFLLVAAIATWTRKEKPSRVVLLSREQTEEWKGWMQWAFIMYHYYRVYYVYNEIRVFVSAYVWMTGFGNFLYFDKKGDYSIERIISMLLRINYFPLLLSFCLSVPLDLYYVVPLHTCGFIMTMATCFLAVQLEKKLGLTYWKSRCFAIGLSLIAHIIFFETPLVDVLLLFSKELHFRFQADKYSAWMGVASGLLMGKASEYMQWAHGGENKRTFIQAVQASLGVFLIVLWWFAFGHINDKYAYNPIHPYIFIIPTLGWLMVRNSSRYLTESHSWFLEFLGRNTLETYVLQFHVFMCRNVQHIPVVIPGSGSDGTALLKAANMLLCGIIFVGLAVLARKNTVATQLAVVDLVKDFRGSHEHTEKDSNSAPSEDEARAFLNKAENGASEVSLEMK